MNRGKPGAEPQEKKRGALGFNSLFEVGEVVRDQVTWGR